MVTVTATVTVMEVTKLPKAYEMQLTDGADMPPQANAQILSPLHERLLYAKSILMDLAHLIVVRRQRSRGQVLADYDQGEWAQQKRAEWWTRAKSLDDYLLPSANNLMVAMIDGRLRKIKAHDYYSFRISKLQQIFRRYAGDTNTLIELGCGSGRNLFSLALDKHWRKLVGYDLSPIGIEIVGAVKNQFGLTNVEAHQIDLLADEDTYPDLTGGTVFSFLCLEQLPGQASDVLRKVIARGAKRGIHIEPSLERFSNWSLRDLATISYIHRQDYQRTIVSSIEQLQREGLLNIVAIERPGFTPSYRNEPMLCVWEALV